MLTLTRRLHQEIVIGEGADEIRLVVKRVKGGSVRIGIAAPLKVRVRRAELPEDAVSQKALAYAEAAEGRQACRAS